MGVQLDTTNTFIDGDMVNAAAVNNIIDQAFATLTGGLITAQTAFAGPSIDPAADKMLIYDASASGLRQAFISALPGAGTVTNVSAVLDNSVAVFGFTVATGATTPVIHLSLDAQNQNKVLAAPANGTLATPTFRALVPADIPIARVSIGALAIDWSLGNTFDKTLPTGTSFNFTFTNMTDGQTIRVRIVNNAAGNGNAHWTTGTPLWRGGGEPILTQTPNARDVYTFTNWNGTVYGYSDQNFRT